MIVIDIIFLNCKMNSKSHVLNKRMNVLCIWSSQLTKHYLQKDAVEAGHGNLEASKIFRADVRNIVRFVFVLWEQILMSFSFTQQYSASLQWRIYTIFLSHFVAHCPGLTTVMRFPPHLFNFSFIPFFL